MTASKAIIVAITMVTMMHVVTGSLMMTATVAIVRITRVGDLSNKAARQWSSLEGTALPCTHHWWVFICVNMRSGN